MVYNVYRATITLARMKCPGVARFASAVKWGFIVIWLRICHILVRARIRRKIRRGKPLRVLFVETEVAKWKTQSLFDLMKKDSHYEPVVLVGRRDYDEGGDPDSIAQHLNEDMKFFKARGNSCVNAYDPSDLQMKKLKGYHPDLIFYQQSWCAASCVDAARYAVTCYVPYYVANYGSLDIDARQVLHRCLSYYFVLNEAWVAALTDWAPWYFYSGRFVPVGHTMLDHTYLSPAPEPQGQCVIYAPHFSFVTETIENLTGISTFPWSGMPILEYAKAHREMNWVFKPHPALYSKLINTGFMTRDEVKRYYQEWNSFATICTDGGYQELFDRATAMVTDCGSFLTEFGATGKPIVRLVSSRAHVRPMKPSQELYSTYYNVNNLDEMYRAFELVLEQQKDPMKAIRKAAVKKAGLLGNYAAKKIMDFFDVEFGITR